jgi:hypothetical protein
MLVYANGGHPPPVVRPPDGGAYRLDRGISPLIGALPAGELVRGDAAVILPAGALLLLTPTAWWKAAAGTSTRASTCSAAPCPRWTPRRSRPGLRRHHRQHDRPRPGRRRRLTIRID